MTRGPDERGKLWGVGTGPGDPELLTVKAVRVLKEAAVVAFFAKEGHGGNARRTAAALIPPGTPELPLLYPVTTEIETDHADYRRLIEDFFDAAAERVARHLAAGRSVAVLSEGDPMFYGSYMHLHVRLGARFPAEIVPGVTAMSGCWSQVGMPIVQGDDVLCVLPGTMDEGELARRLADTQAAVVMKVGRNLPKIRRALAGAGRLGEAVYVERGTMEETRHLPLVERGDERAPYFSLVLVPGWSGRRP